MSVTGTPHSHDPEQQFFMSDKIVILVETDSQNDIEPRIIEWVEEHISPILMEFEVHQPDTRPIIDSFQVGDESLGTIIVDVNIQHSHDWAEKLMSVISTIMSGSINANGIRLQAVSPNWLFGSATHGFGDGGPGGEPVPVNDKDKEAYKFDNVVKTRITDYDQCSGDEPASVNVVILDTLPRSYEEINHNALLNSLKSQLTVHDANSTGIPLPNSPTNGGEDYWLKDKKYKITDHGLFIAGTIHSWAPYAKIQLVEVMNDYGVCSLVGVIQAFKWIRDNLPTDFPLVINCSFCLTASLSLIHCLPHWQNSASSDREYLLFNLLQNCNPYLLMLPLQRVIESIRTTFSEADMGMRVIAAAGNEAQSGKVPPDARYPAAYPCVIGIGAVDKDGNRTAYSNKADSPPYVGMMVFGGKAEWDDTKSKYVTLPKEGMLGIYLDDFPDGNPSTNGWAWWSGTSFATGVMSGMFAYGASQGCDISCECDVDFLDKLIEVKDRDTLTGEPTIITPQKA